MKKQIGRCEWCGDIARGACGCDAEIEIERLRAVLERISTMDPATDSIEGHNEWGEADCFHQAQSAALLALGPNVADDRRL